MSDVRCTGKKCRGDFHDLTCEKYKAAMLAFAGKPRGTDADRLKAKHRERDAQRADKGHQKKAPEQLMTSEQRSAAILASGRAGRPKGSFNALPMGMIQALKTINYGAKPDASDTEKELVNFSTEELIKVAAGMGGNSKRLPTKLKAIFRIRDEACVPIVSESKVTADVSMSNQVRAAQKLVLERKAAREAKKGEVK